jgi:predicted DNA binding protein
MIAECLVVEFRVTGDDCPLADASRTTGTTIDARAPQGRDDGNVLLRASAPADAGIADILDADDRIRYLHVSTADGRENYRCLAKQRCVVHELTDEGFLVESLRYSDGEEFYTGAVVGHDVLQRVLEAAGETVGVTLERVSPLREADETPVARRWDLTPAQTEAVQTALSMGYFEVPRQVTAGDVAAELNVSKSAFLERLRRAEGALFAQLFA